MGQVILSRAMKDNLASSMTLHFFMNRDNDAITHNVKKVLGQVVFDA
jgi:hypothetical protein